MADENAYALAGRAEGRAGRAQSAPGRAIVDGFETQIAVLGGTAERRRADQDPRSSRPTTSARAARARSPRSARCPRACRRDELPDRIDGLPVLGVADDTLAAREFEPVGTFVVAGPPLSRQDERHEGARPVDGAVRPRRQAVPLRRPALAAAGTSRRGCAAPCTTEDAKDLATELAELVADESLHGAHHDRRRGRAAVRRLPRRAAAQGALPGGEAQRAPPHRRRRHQPGHERLRADRRLQVRTARASRCEPDTYDGEALFKVPFPQRASAHDFPEGRGIFVENGRNVTVQLPWHEDARGESSPLSR